MGKDDPPFTFRQELQAQRQTSRSSNTELNEEEHREIIIQKTMHALAVSEEFTKLIVKRMEQTGNFSSQPSQSSPASSPILDNSKSQRKRKAGNIQMDTREAKRRKGNDDSVKLENGLYTNAQNLKVSVRQPRLLEGAVMRDYQLDGLEWLVALDLNGANGILADEMGLGKTLQVISLICFLVEMGVGKEAPFLVIGPLSTLSNWVAEFQKFAPKIPVILYHGSKEERAPLREEIFRIKKVEDAETHPVVITSYEMPLRDPNLSKINWRYLIIDEGHRLKNHKCHLFKELRRYHSTNRLLLTGTPLQNNMSELWSLLNFILPNVVNDMDVFKCWFNPSFLESSDGNNKIVEAEQKDKVVTTLHKILKPFLLRRVKADVGLNLPPKKEVIVFAQMTQLQRRLYSAVVDKNVYSLQGKQPDIDDPVSLEKAIRHCRKSVADREQETDLLDPSEAIDVTKVTSIRKRRSNRSSTVQNGDYKLLANGVPVNAIREEPMYLQGDNTCEISEDKLLEGIVGPDEEFVTAIRIANPVSVLRQICNHPYLASYPVLPGTKIMKVDENIVQFSGKMQILDALLTRLKKNGHKVLLFSNFTKMLDLIEDYLILREYQYTRLDGTRNLSDRQDNISKFNSDEDVFVFLISTRAGGLGINLVAADTVIIYDSDWNPQADLQAQDRCHRIGQTKPVVVYRLVVQGTVDQHMLECAEKKKQLDKLVIQHGKFKNVKEDEMVTIEELRKLLGTKDGSEVVLDTGLVYSEKELDELCHRSIIFGSQNTSDKGEFEKDALKNEELSDSHDVESCSSGASSSIDSCDSLVFGESSESGGSAEALNSIEREL